ALLPVVRLALHHLRARAAARAHRGQEERPAGRLRSRQAAALDLGRGAQAPGRSRAGRARGERHRAPPRKLRRERDTLDADRRAGDGRAARARSGRLCALRLGLSQFPRGPGLRGVHLRSRRDREPQGLTMMRAALALARRSLGRTWPNPAVGCVIVRDGVVVGRGRTQDGGRPHAEVDALNQAGEAARGATAYVTLEPCSHFGKSPPCADALIAAGFLLRLLAGRPLFHLKLATSLDGRIATASGESRWITGEAARADGHRLRATHEAILVGGNTATLDDPELTC